MKRNGAFDSALDNLVELFDAKERPNKAFAIAFCVFVAFAAGLTGTLIYLDVHRPASWQSFLERGAYRAGFTDCQNNLPPEVTP